MIQIFYRAAAQVRPRLIFARSFSSILVNSDQIAPPDQTVAPPKNEAPQVVDP